MAQSLDDAFKIFSDVYDRLAEKAEERIPGYVTVGEYIPDFRRALWRRYQINRAEFQEFLQQLRAESSPYRMKINLYGGPIYLKDDWVECDGRHWLLIEVRTEDHERKMAPHRSS